MEDTKQKQTAYLAGPMRNLEFFNFPAFHKASADLRKRGYDVLSPAEHDEEDGFNPKTSTLEEFNLEKAMMWDIGAILQSDLMIVLPGWRESSGVAIEKTIADAIGIPTLEYPDLIDTDESVLQEAHRLIHGPREDSYGHPYFDMSRTGRIWGALLGIDDIPAEMVSLCMVGVKMSREVNSPKRDNRTDGAGYFGCIDRIHEYYANNPGE